LLVVPNALLARLFFGQRVSAQFLAGSAVAMVGVALLFWAELRLADTRALPVLIGIGLTLLAVLSASAGNLLQLAERVKSLPVASLLAWATFYGAVVNAAIAIGLHGAPVSETRAGYWIGLIYLGLFASALAFFFYYRIIRAIGPAKAAYSSVLVPIVAMGLSTVFEGYRWTSLAAAGGLLAVAGLLVALSGRRPPEPAPVAD
jgi:drug/metabolite transporter (DMT)-like permease